MKKQKISFCAFSFISGDCVHRRKNISHIYGRRDWQMIPNIIINWTRTIVRSSVYAGGPLVCERARVHIGFSFFLCDGRARSLVRWAMVVWACAVLRWCLWAPRCDCWLHSVLIHSKWRTTIGNVCTTHVHTKRTHTTHFHFNFFLYNFISFEFEGFVFRFCWMRGIEARKEKNKKN